MPAKYIDIIDPTSIDYATGEHSLAHKKAWVLDLFLQQQEEKYQNRNIFQRFFGSLFGWLIGRKTITFKKNETYTVYLPDEHDPTQFEPKKFKLTHDIVCSHVKIKSIGRKGKSVPEYNIINPDEKKFGQGVWGTVLRVVGVLTRRNGPLAFKNKKKMVDKVQTITARSAKREAKILRKMHRTSKPITMEYLPFLRQRSHIVDKEFGMSLTKFLKSPECKTLSFEKRLLLSVNFLRELQTIHARGFIHHDIWPNNVLVDPDTGEVVIIDFGSARSMNAWIQGGGKKRYAAPEKFSLGRETVDKRSDVYAAMLTLVSLWGGKKRGRFTFRENFFEACRQLFSLMFFGEDTFSLDTLGKGLDISQSNIGVIATILRSGLTFSPKGRAELDTIITNLEQLRIQDPTILSAFLEANSTHSDLLQIEKSSATLFGKKAEQNKKALMQIYPTLKKSLMRFGKTPPELNEYIYTLGVQAFQGATTKGEILKRTKAIIRDYVAYSAKLKPMHDDLARQLNILKREKNPNHAKLITLLQDQLYQLYYIIYKMESHHMRLDDLVKINKHCKKRLERVEKALANIEKDSLSQTSSHLQILKRLTLVKETDDLTHLQNQIRLAVRKYLVEREVSKERVVDMNRILDQIDDPENSSVAKLEKGLAKPLKKIDKSVWLFGKSELSTGIKEAIRPSLYS